MLQITIETRNSLRIQKARTALLLDHPFFGSLLYRLKDRESRAVKTMATDGVSLLWNPEFVDTLTAATLAGTLAHEVMHPALHHHLRRSGRDPKKWNIACDYAINPLLIDAGLKLPEGVLLENQFRGMSAEQICNLLESEEDTDPDSNDDQQPPPSTDRNSGPDGSELNEPSAPETDGGIGQVLDAPLNAPGEGDDSPTEQEQGREWEIAVKQAMTVAQQAGKMPAGLVRTMEGAAEAAVNWRELLRRLWSETTAADYSWMRPNRRHLWRGLYLPGVVKESVGEIVIAVDCSGSISGRQLRLFEAEARSILEGQRPERVYVLYFDAVVQKVEVYEAGQPISLNPVGGGGTEFAPCFEWVEERGIMPQTMVFLTDLYGSFPSSAPSYPVLWASTGRRQAPFGEVIPMQSA
jgi:predicted metal-dependent peptidase